MINRLYLYLYNCKYYDKISKKEHYYLYISQLITAILYFILILANLNRIVDVSIYILSLIIGTIILFINSKKDIGLYILSFVILYLTRFDFMLLNDYLIISLHITLMLSCFIAIMVNFRFNINYKVSIFFVCSSIILMSLITNYWISKITLIYLTENYIETITLYVFTANIAIIIGMLALYNSYESSLFDKKFFGIGFDIIFEFARTKNNLIIDDEYIVNKNNYYNISTVHKVYALFMSCKIQTSVCVWILISTIFTLVLKNLNLIVIIMIFNTAYCIHIYNNIKLLKVDEERFKEYLWNFISFSCFSSIDSNFLNKIKERLQEYVETNKISKREKKEFCNMLGLAIKDTKNILKNIGDNKNNTKDLYKNKLEVLNDTKCLFENRDTPKLILN